MHASTMSFRMKEQDSNKGKPPQPPAQACTPFRSGHSSRLFPQFLRQAAIPPPAGCWCCSSASIPLITTL